jgi:hypothetical protein
MYLLIRIIPLAVPSGSLSSKWVKDVLFCCMFFVSNKVPRYKQTNFVYLFFQLSP